MTKMNPHFIVCGETKEPTWDSEHEEIRKFLTHVDADANAKERAAEEPGERFAVYAPVSFTEAAVGEPVTHQVEAADPSHDSGELPRIVPRRTSCTGR